MHREIIDSHFWDERQLMHYSRKILYYWTKNGYIQHLLLIPVFATLLLDVFCEDF